MIRTVMLSSRNPGKLREIQAFLTPFEIEVIPLPADAPEVEEIGSTFAENARLKAETMAKRYGVPVIADDSGLVVDLLEGAPGVRSARYAGEQATDEENLRKLLFEIKQKLAQKTGDPTAEPDPAVPITARFVCEIALAKPNGSTQLVSGVCEGKISLTPRGNQGFGYDPVFVVLPGERTLAELSLEEKNQVSHRAKALQELVKCFESRHV